jgi:RHS repeat-associated protein
MIKAASFAFVLLSLVLFLAAPTRAQDPNTGFPLYGSFMNGNFDAVNLQDLNVNFPIPIVNTPGRGMNFRLALVNDSSIYRSGGTAWLPVTDQSGNPTWGWKAVSPTGSIAFRVTTIQIRCGDGSFNFKTTYNHYTYVDPAGTTHSFPLVSVNDDGCTGLISGTTSGFASDNSGYFLADPGAGFPVVTSHSGITVDWTGKMTDPNGNYINSTVVNSSETDWKDTLGRVALKIITSSSEIQYQYLDVNGAYQTIHYRFGSFNIKTNFNCAGVADYTSTSAVSLPTEIDLPNGKSYLIGYEPTPGNSGYYTGRVKTVTLPTGGSYEYDYGATNDGASCTDGSTVNLTRKMNDGAGNISTWVFTRSGNVTTEQFPTGDQTVLTFNSSNLETQRKIYHGTSSSGTLLRTINTTSATNGTPATKITILEDGSTQNEEEITFDTFGNLQLLKEHDWGTGAPGGVLRTTTYTYITSSAYTNLNIRNLLTTTTVADLNGTIQSRTDIAYDTPADINTSCPTGVPQHDDTGHGCSFTTRGLPTTVTTYPTDPVTPSGGIPKTLTYDFFGNLRTVQLNCCQFKTTWIFSSTTNYAFADSVTSASSSPTLSTSAIYNQYTGQVTTSTDENGKPTTYAYADPGHMNRLTSITRPDSAQITYAYDDTAKTVTVTTPITSANNKKQITAFDGLGRLSTTTIQDSSNTTYSIVQTLYDNMGRANKTSNPYTGSPSYFTTTAFDTLGRPTSVTLPDNSATSYSYTANTVTITDPAGKKRETKTDGLGRLVAAIEPDGNGNLNQQTSYAYTVLDALATVTGVGSAQTRTYGYDHMGRLTSVAIPETNNTATGYQYNNFDLVTQRMDPRGVITTYGYDNLNRLHTVDYNVGTTGVAATPSLVYTYGTNSAQNNNGRLITLTDGVGSENYSYDPNLPLMTQVQKVVSGTTYTTGYQHNLAGEVTQITYPSGRVVQQNFDPIGRLCAIAQQTSSTCATNTNPYATGYAYNTASELTGFNYANGVTASFGYSADRLQMTSLSYMKGTSTLYNLNYFYKTDATYCPNAPGGDNGQIQCIRDLMDNGRTVTFTYDNLARLANAVTVGSTAYPKWGLQWSYDAYGSRLTQGILSGCTGLTCPTNSVTVSTSTNRITTSGYGYDANGNMTNDGQNTLTYDGENHLLTSSGSLGSGTYTYDGNGQRVKKVSSSTTTVYSFSGSRVIAEYVNGAAPASPTREYIYSGSALLAKIEGTATQYYQQDHLSTRLMTDSTGTKIGEQGHFPYGETWYLNNTTTKWEFTSYERDAESGNDYAMARYHVNRLGRFSSPDLLSGSTGDPQSLNKFTYVRNDPANGVDPSGTVSCWWPDSCGGEDPGGGDGGGGCSFGSCNEDPPSGGHPDTCGTFCGPAGDFGFPGSPQANGFIATGPGIDWLNLLFGPPQGTIIQDWIQDTNGNIIGERDGEQLCDSDGSNCQNLFWNPSLAEWGGPRSPQQEYQACMTPFKNSLLGKAVNFGSVLSFADDLWDTGKKWGEAIALKGIIFGALTAGANSAAGGVSPVTSGTKWFFKKASPIGITAASLADLGARSACTGNAFPELLPSPDTGWE